ncbi:hypothetical protein Tco_0781223 [Tanacetum coccineum]
MDPKTATYNSSRSGGRGAGNDGNEGGNPISLQLSLNNSKTCSQLSSNKLATTSTTAEMEMAEGMMTQHWEKC